jgi:hypothetical protein
MNDNKALVPVGEMSIDEVMRVGKAMAASGYFKDANDVAKAVVKVLAGREMGFGPFASMTGIHIIQGKPAIGANLMAAAVKNHPKYDYRIVQFDDDACSIDFYQGDRLLGNSTFTMELAQSTKYFDKKANAWVPLASKWNWENYPRNLMFARTISNGVKWYCPDVFLGAPVYTPDELGAETNQDGDVVDVTPTPVKHQTESPVLTDIEDGRWFQSWTHLKETAVEHLGYKHVQHVENTLKQVFSGDGDSLTFAAAWEALVAHQQAKETESDDSGEQWPAELETETAAEGVTA